MAAGTSATGTSAMTCYPQTAVLRRRARGQGYSTSPQRSQAADRGRPLRGSSCALSRGTGEQRMWPFSNPGETFPLLSTHLTTTFWLTDDINLFTGVRRSSIAEP